jgi:hypothetical protein
MKKITFLLLFTVISSCLWAQTKKPATKPASNTAEKEVISYYKIENGVKTKVDPSLPFVIKMDNQGNPLTNMEVTIEIEEWRKKYPYDIFLFLIHNITTDKNVSFDKYMNFVDTESAKFLSNLKTRKFLLFYSKSEEYENHLPMLYEQNKIYTSMANDTLDFRILGAYSGGTETYFDNSSNSVKTHHTFGQYTKLKPFTKLVIQFDPEYLMKVESQNLRSQIDDEHHSEFKLNNKTYPTIKGLCDQWIASFSKSSSEMTSAKQFILTYMNTKLEELRKNTDNASYIHEVSKLMKRAACFDFTSVSLEDKKVMDKLVKKSKLPIDDIFKLFQTMNSDYPVPNCDYGSLLPQ